MTALSRDLELTIPSAGIDENSIQRHILEILCDGFRKYSVRYKDFVHTMAAIPATQELFYQEMVPIIEEFLGDTTSELNHAFNAMLHPIKDRQHLSVVMQHLQNITKMR